MTDSQCQHPDLLDAYNQGWLTFNGLVTCLFYTGMYKPRECYAIARSAEEAWMQSVAKRAWEKQDE